MLNNKWIKGLCYTLMGFMDVIAIILMIYGISDLLKEDANSIGWIFIIIGIVIPIAVSVGIYPIFALANIDKNFTDINKKYDLIINQMMIANKEKFSDVNITIEEKLKHVNKLDEKNNNISNINNSTSSIDESQNMNSVGDEYLPNELVEYLNEKYDLTIDINDSFEIIKMKIQGIDADDNSKTITFKSRSGSSKDVKELISIIKMHKIVNE